MLTERTPGRHTWPMLLLLSLVLVACDGGIFGTGDGRPVIIESDITGAPSGDTPTNPAIGEDGPEAGGEDQSPDAPLTPVNEDGSAAESPPGTAHDVVELENSISNFDRLTHVVLSADGLQEFSFANPFVTQTNNARTISVINLTNTRITVSDLNSTTSTNPLLSSVGQLPVSANLANTTSGLVFHNFDENGRRRILVQVDLSEVKAGSESLFIISNTEPNPYIVALPVITNGVNRSSSALRIIATSLLGDPLTPSTFTLSQTFDTSSNSVPASYVSEPLNFDLPVSNYITLPAGIYTLRDDMGRYTRIDIGFLPADTINTLILNPNLDAGLLLLRDSP